MTSHRAKDLFPLEGDLIPRRSVDHGVLKGVRREGSHESLEELYGIHIDLLAEDFLCALSDQINNIREEPELLQEDPDCYSVTSVRVRERGQSKRCSGIEFHFVDASRYEQVDWEEEKRLTKWNNLVFLTQDNLQTFIVGAIQESGQRMLQEGRFVVNVVSGVKANGDFEEVEHLDSYLNQTFDLIEADAFHRPYHLVTRALRRDIKLINLRRSCGKPLEFEDEIVGCKLPSPKPAYLKEPSVGDAVKRLFEMLKPSLSDSQRVAMDSVLNHRVALVQGPPGTGKTFLGTKVIQLFLLLKQQYPSIFKGPILMVSTTNHAVVEFLRRCSDFTDKIIDCSSGRLESDRHGPLQRKYDKAPRSKQHKILKDADLVGMTTTRAACIREKLDDMEIKIVMVEEAGEAFEAHVLACIPIGTCHLIQIGDHKQLRPSPAYRGMAREYHLDVSLFERLISNGADCVMLQEQRRMRPAIAKLVECFYDDLTNHPCTLKRPSLTGVDLEEPVFFLNHGDEETEDGKGYFNRTEAEVAVELAEYLVQQQHYKPGSITVLTSYRRQLRLIMELLAGKKSEIQATTVDNFQGEENDIVILSLVRSNAAASVGFLKKANRACVALSRARDGFIMLGNLECLATSGVPAWKNVDAVLSPEGRVGSSLPLVCPHGHKFPVTTAADIRVAATGCGLCQGLPSSTGPELAMPSEGRADLADAESINSAEKRNAFLKKAVARKIAMEDSVNQLSATLDAQRL